MKLKQLSVATVGAVSIVLAVVANAQAAILTNSGFNANTLARNDDSSTGLVPIGFGINFFGTTYTSLYVNNNGNVTFNAPLGQYTPNGLNGDNGGRPIIAPFFADVDTRNPASNEVTYGTDIVNGRQAFGVNYINVGYYNSQADKLNSFQLVLIDRSDVGAGNFDIQFNYDKIQWETGSASDGINGFGGRSARVGYSNGTGTPGTFFELSGSGAPGSFLDSNTGTGLIHNSIGSSLNGRDLFSVRNGNVTPAPDPSAVPFEFSPGLGILALGACGAVAQLKSKVQKLKFSVVSGEMEK